MSCGFAYVYTTDKWSHREQSNIDGVVLILRADEIDSLPMLLKNKLGLIN